MKLEDLYVPALMSRLMNDVLVAKMNDNQAKATGWVQVREDLLVELFRLAGAVPGADIQKMNQNELLESASGAVPSYMHENQIFNIQLPEAIIEEWSGKGENLVRAIMNFKNLTLKEVGERYGGKSGAANLANFMAKSNDELAAMRDSTLRRLAGALDCPEEWLFVVRPEEDPDEGL